MSNPFEAIEQKLTNIENLLLNLREEKPEVPKTSYLTRIQAAELLHLTLPTLNQYTKAGIIKGFRIGSRVLYDETSIKEAVKAMPTLKYRR